MRSQAFLEDVLRAARRAGAKGTGSHEIAARLHSGRKRTRRALVSLAHHGFVTSRSAHAGPHMSTLWVALPPPDFESVKLIAARQDFDKKTLQDAQA